MFKLKVIFDLVFDVEIFFYIMYLYLLMGFMLYLYFKCVVLQKRLKDEKRG